MTTDDRLGVWLLGARGSVATTAAVGLHAVAHAGNPATGLVTETAPFDGLPLPALAGLVLGGHDLSEESLLVRAARLADDGVVPHSGLLAARDWLDAIDQRVRRGVDVAAAGQAPCRSVNQVVADLDAFRAEADLRDAVVVQLTTTEAQPDPAVLGLDTEGLRQALAGHGPTLPPSVVYAVAALQAGCAFVDFTPSVATSVPGVVALAAELGLPLAGRDGKTGETLLKSALAPMFVDRALKVRSWTGTNLLGGGDGAALANPARRASKTALKSGTLEALLGDDVEAPVVIEHVADMGEWKTAWDHIAFEGFLGTRMRLQFTWDGCDSTLAAPLVLDLARLAGAALRAGQAGVLTELGYFFKDPVGSDEHRLAEQFDRLCAWAHRLPDRTVWVSA